jgi:membrane protein
MKNRLRRFVQLWINLFDRHLRLDHASAIAFQVLKSTIPLTLLGLAILGASGEQRVWRKTLAPAIEPKVQKPTFHAINYGVDKIFSSDSTGLIVFASLLSLWYISGAVRAMTGALNDIYETEDDRSWPKRYAVSFALAGCIAIGVIGALLATIILGHVRGPLEIVAQIGRWIVAIILLAISLGLLVRFAPARHRSKKWAGAGSALVIVAWIGATLIFELFVSHVANFKTATGELTVFLVLIGYVYTSSIILMVGVELDELLREDTTGQRGVLHVLFGYGK